MTGAGQDIRSLFSKLCGPDIEEIETRRSEVTRGSKSGSKHLAFIPLTAGGWGRDSGAKSRLQRTSELMMRSR